MTGGPINVLLVGGGGREHALAWKLKQSPRLATLYAAPGSDAILELAQPLGCGIDDGAALAQACLDKGVKLVVVGPEAPLAAGLADALRAAGLAVFGPGKLGAQLEASKDFAKQFMLRHGVATAQARSFDNKGAALDFARTLGLPVVVKADGLAAGKGVTVCEDAAMLEAALAGIFDAKLFGDAGSKALIEEFMPGEEASLLCFCDGKVLRPMVAVQDHKRIGEGDTGPNTGGMGAYSPAPVLDDAVMTQVWERILSPTLAGLNAEGLDFRGCLYVGLMIGPQGPRVVEYNVRFGDPETQVVLPRLDSDLLEVLWACSQGRLAELPPLAWKDGACATVVWASAGYPASADKGQAISGLEQAAEQAGAVVFHAGTALKDGVWRTSGGRVLAVTALGPDLKSALQAAYAAGAKISFQGMQFRRDIGHRALARG
jgi:phosphoribosylamine--glycine ligase